MTEMDIGAAEWYLDPNEVDNKVSEMTKLVDDTVAKYPNLPGLENKLGEELYASSAALRLTAQQETQKLVEDQVTSKLQQVAAQYGYQGKDGKFQDVYTDMVDVIAPFATALGGPNAARDLLTKNYDAYFKNHYGTIANFPNADNIKLLQEAILNPDMQSIISPETMGGAIKTQKQMTAALNTKGTSSEYAQRIEALKYMDEFRKANKMPLMDKKKRLDFLMYGNREKADPSKLSKKEEREELLKWADPTNQLLSDKIRMHYRLEGKIPDNIDTKIDARKAKIDKMNEERVAAGLPKYSERIYDHFVLGGVLLDDSPLEKSKAEIAYIEKPVSEGGLGIPLDPVQKKNIIAKNYEMSAKESADSKVDEATAIVNTGKPEDKKVPLTQPQLDIVAGVNEKKPLVTIKNTGPDAFKEKAWKDTAEEASQMVKDKKLAFGNLNRLKVLKSLLTDKKNPFITGSFASTRLFVSKLADFANTVSPSPSMQLVIDTVGKASTAEAFDRVSKEMLLIMAKYVGRITNLSLTFARDTVPGLLKTKEGNLVIIAFMKRDAQRQVELGKIAQKYIRLGSITPEGEVDMFTALDNYEATDFFDDELKQAIAEARKVLPEFKQVLSPKNLQSLRANPPKASNKAFLSYLKKYDIKLPYGTKFRRTVNGFHQYVHPDGTGTDIPVHWDDKKQTTMTGKGNWEPSTPPVTNTSPLTLDTLGSVTLDQISSAPPQEIANFYKANKGAIEKLVPPDILKVIEDIFNEVTTP
tara:strand:+ start:297 stop:2561 length:2265 start_codon:yes stop_codon:yes gene_type:complete